MSPEVYEAFFNGVAVGGLICLVWVAVGALLKAVGAGLKELLPRVVGFDWVVLSGYAVMLAVFVLVFLAGK